ncbi:MAG: type IX secretion system membrane protein PorP/SprF [Chlorobi bacterium]|nr:type IX secretion system membrane protein PorP/SprF [Chlorobiota bacterium]
MKSLYRILFLILIVSGAFTRAGAQEGVPVYYDYLTDNLHLIHPAMMGASTCSKVRLTGRMQWTGVNDFPMLQTLSLSSHLGKNSGFGLIIYNDRNGYHRQTGVQVAFAHHLLLSQGEVLNKLSFGISGMYSFNQLDESTFDPSDFDPVVSYTLRSGGYFNMDVGLAYHYENFFFLASAKNLLLIPRPLYGPAENVNLRNYVGTIGYFFGKGVGFHVEPSVMLQYKEFNGDLIGDLNVKFYHDMNNAAFFYGVSYRNYLGTMSQNPLHDITPIVGVYAGKFFAAYLYTYQLSDATFSNGGFHQISLGYNFDCRPRIYRYGCPHIR